MVQVNIVVREPGKESPDYSLDFDLPEVPSIGSYISITRDGENELYSEDLLVRHVWWRLRHPASEGVSTGRKVGAANEIVVECDIAEGPFASAHWVKWAAAARARGAKVETFGIARYSIPQEELEGLRRGDPEPDQG